MVLHMAVSIGANSASRSRFRRLLLSPHQSQYFATVLLGDQFNGVHNPFLFTTLLK